MVGSGLSMTMDMSAGGAAGSRATWAGLAMNSSMTGSRGTSGLTIESKSVSTVGRVVRGVMVVDGEMSESSPEGGYRNSSRVQEK